ncbi:TetR/AcrR family transcriptional regulator [Rhodococcus opacus]|uniref:TetR/AcrR family transcriptional regulator n=1 Tax=Rhodococcus opacus TaxID=37919 RepID=UPI002949AC64|nr:TetR/AcrR family transcriptional regulator [Rhodococcus opacus]MDV6244915.1 TetR/AcrR family transcriptional regulator [Rhodococcus opacus]
MSPLNTRESLIESTEHLIRAKGYSAFSYADLEKEIGIRKASIHYHFPTKEDLGVCVVETHLAHLKEQFMSIDGNCPEALGRLGAFARLFTEGRSTGQLPLCGALAAEMTVLPEKMQALTTTYLETQMQWLEKTILGGIASGEIPPTGDARQKAYEILSLLEGASFVSWGLQSRGEIGPSVIGLILGKN